MDLYSQIASFLGWPPIVALLLACGGYVLYLQNIRIAQLKERNNELEKQYIDYQRFSPDVLAIRLGENLRIANEEIRVLYRDFETSKKTISEKENEIEGIKNQITTLAKQIDSAQELLKLVSDFGLVCPYCRAPLETREYHNSSEEYQGHDYDIEHELIRYDCGLEIMNGHIISKCKSEKSEISD